MTREEFMAHLEAISGGGETDRVFGAMNELKSFYGEYEAKTAPENVVVEGKTAIQWKDEALAAQAAMLEQNDAWKKKFHDTFFSSASEVKEEVKADVKRDGTVQTFAQLFERKEG
nr:MAG TPA: hypothetical protein [Caudoviricetes sp.]